MNIILIIIVAVLVLHRVQRRALLDSFAFCPIVQSFHSLQEQCYLLSAQVFILKGW